MMGLLWDASWRTGCFLFLNLITLSRGQRSMSASKQKVCTFEQDRADLDCPCRFGELPCRVPGSICTTGFIPGIMDSELRCQCSGYFERGPERNCVERPAAILGVPPPPPPAQELGVIAPVSEQQQIEGPNDFDFIPVNRAHLSSSSNKHVHTAAKRPSKGRPPFRTVMITSSPLQANPPSRRPQIKPNFHNGMGIGMESPSLNSVLTQNRPRQPFFNLPTSKGLGGKGTALPHGNNKNKGSKRPPVRFPKRTTRSLPRADGSQVVNGWYPDIWPAVGLNYSI
ncbi:hypothetical protein BV898_15921 [Hypsibius exemplaris]|uniref:EB domain-containing protein n=1 Tax=Hypsibius exemplaris TaxID=2072580 RepID=A0A9X6RL13_HYPEX|nr:hypothetical protein BV898_15921 [Hypsibius exemplaris]